MDGFLQRVKSFANEAAKISHEYAQETAKRSKELASKADQLKALAGDIRLSIPSALTASSSAISVPASTSSSVESDEELVKYGITQELREFVRGLTLTTFRDFPAEELNTDVKDDTSTSNVRQDLTEWQEQHAVKLLKAVPEISQFRYELCPKHMKEKRFWKIYFTLVKNHVVLYEAQRVLPEDFLSEDQRKSAMAPLTTHEGIQMTEKPSNVVEASQKKQPIDDQDLDAFLLGDLDSDGDEDVGSDAEFDQLVNSSALDSDAEEEHTGSQATN